VRSRDAARAQVLEPLAHCLGQKRDCLPAAHAMIFRRQSLLSDALILSRPLLCVV
jgi:hypothetical protein